VDAAAGAEVSFQFATVMAELPLEFSSILSEFANVTPDLAAAGGLRDGIRSERDQKSKQQY
jgi:hypothetical protein